MNKEEFIPYGHQWIDEEDMVEGIEKTKKWVKGELGL